MKKICVFIPTMNRSECINAYLDKVLSVAEKSNIDFYISDTSTDNRTEEIIKEYSKTYSKLKYRHYDNYPDRTTDLKVVEGFEELKSQYDYIWLCGDGCILLIEKWLPVIEAYLEQDFELVYFSNCTDKDSEVITVCTDVHEFFKEHAWYATYYCATMISSNFVNMDLMKSLYPKWKNSGYLYWRFLFENLSLNQEVQIAVCNGTFFEVNPYKSLNSSYKPGRFLDFWAGNWVNVVESLPDYYTSSEKENVMKRVGIELKSYDIENLFLLRKTDNLSRKLYLEYKERLKKVTGKKLGLIKFISFSPKCLVNGMHILYRVLRRIKRRIKRG